jgi:glycosyltransferase involved in cell wall biosynthesis
VAGFLDWKSFFHKNTKPVVWTLHDENPFLGIEHYAERFQGMDQYGKPIQRQYAADEWQEEQKMRHYKRKVLAHLNSPLVIVCPSLWLMGESKKSEILGKYEHHHIPYGFPTHIFSPLRKDFCREVLGLPKDKKLVLFVADSLTNARKGLAFLKQAVQEMQSPDCCFCVVGKCNSDIKSAFGNIIALGEIGDERLMAVAYSAADLFVIPSLEDNLPNTMIEALLCGTPVVGFPTGGIPEVIKNDYNGWICPEVSVASLKKNIQEALKKLDSLNREHIATDAKKQFSLERQAEAYRQLYEELMSKF